MYSVVANVEAYPRFLNWCSEVEILHQDNRTKHGEPEVVLAKMGVSYARLNFSFTTRNENLPGESIHLYLDEGPFSTFTGRWQFLPLGENGCKTSLDMEFAFQQSFGAGLMEKIFEKIASSQLDRFQQRAKALYHVKNTSLLAGHDQLGKLAP
jgi:ribosome-associated toxin RatA of RatAB toxin-antitoxin module